MGSRAWICSACGDENHAGRDQSCGIVGLQAVKETGKEARGGERDRQSKRKAGHNENRDFA